jgi:hypothetical protein
MPFSLCDASSRLAASKTTGSHVRNNLPHFYVAGPFAVKKEYDVSNYQRRYTRYKRREILSLVRCRFYFVLNDSPKPSSGANRKRHTWEAPRTVTSTVVGLDIPVHWAQHHGRWSNRTAAHTISATSICSCVPLIDLSTAGITNPELIPRCSSDRIPRIGRRGIADRSSR